jgi:hypothetical protein
MSWRDEQMRKLDDDYRAYRQENQTKFHTDFETWRNKRAASPAKEKDKDKERERARSQSVKSAGNESKNAAKH